MLDATFSKLEVWQKSHKFVLQIYRVTSKFPPHEKYRLVSQLCRSASSVPTNIVEGNSRISKKEYLRFLITSKGSLEETKYHLLLARDLGYLKPAEFEDLSEQANEVGRMLSGLIKSLK